MAARLGGIDRLRETPLPYVELQAGYCEQGSSKPETAHGLPRSRQTLVGMALNLNETLIGPGAERESGLKNVGRLFLVHIQLPPSAATRTRAFWFQSGCSLRGSAAGFQFRLIRAMVQT